VEKAETILVTGVSGFIASRLALHLLSLGYDVIGVDFNRTKNTDFFLDAGGRFVESYVEDLTKDNFEFEDIKSIFHLAAIKRHNEDIPYVEIYEHNIRATEVVLNFSIEWKCKLVFTSSLYVYGEYDGISYESDIPNPRTIYGMSKAISETYLRSMINIRGANVGIARLYFIVGEENDDRIYQNVIHKFVGQALRGEPITVYGTGNAIINYFWIDDLIQALIALSKRAESSLINLGNSNAHTINQIAEKIARIIPTKISHTKPDWTESTVRHGDTTMSRELLSLNKETTLDKMIETIIQEARSKLC
jgi:nucleoside-diphosphate-sugar epimerase